MPTIHFNKGDRFKFNGGYGMVLHTRVAILLLESGREGYAKQIRPIPDDAMPVGKNKVPFEVTLAFDTTATAMGLPVPS